MAAPIDFYFDFSSPYGYLASECVGGLAARTGREVRWHPILLGTIFKVTGGGPIVAAPVKGDYARRDFARAARRLGLPFVLPDPFPFRSLLPATAFYAIEEPEAATRFARAILRTAFVAGRAPLAEGAVVEAAATAGLDGRRLLEEMASGEAERRCRAATTAALERGVFGSPFFLVEDEPFWGHDRLGDLEAWILRGGW